MSCFNKAKWGFSKFNKKQATNMYDLTSSNLVEVLTTTTTTTTRTLRSKYGDLTNRKSYKQMRIKACWFPKS